MIPAFDNLLRHLFLSNVGQLTDEDQVRFDPPDAEWRKYVSNLTVAGQPANALNIYLVELRENRKLRSNERNRTFENGMAIDRPAPRRVDCHYLISAWSPAATSPAIEPALDEVGLLYEATASLLNAQPLVPAEVYAPNPVPAGFPAEFAADEIPTTVLPVEGFPKYAEFWGTMGQTHPWKPAVYLVATLPVVLAHEPIGPLVTTRITEYRRPDSPAEPSRRLPARRSRVRGLASRRRPPISSSPPSPTKAATSRSPDSPPGPTGFTHGRSARVTTYATSTCPRSAANTTSHTRSRRRARPKARRGKEQPMAIMGFPGVSFEEFTPGAPIQGVGTNVAAFLGPTTVGPLREPVRITSWDGFKREFGELPLAGFYLWYAVRGFFQNGGTVCFVTRVSNATFDSLTLVDQSGAANPTIVVQARAPGVSAPSISVAVNGNRHLVSAANAHVYRPTATIANASGTSVIVTNAEHAARFRPGDPITWNGSTETKPVVVSRIEGQTIRLAEPLGATYSAGKVRLADIAGDATEIRVEGGAGLSAGSLVVIDQAASGANPAVNLTATVKSVAAERISPTLTTHRIVLRKPLGTAIVLDPAASAVTIESQEFSIAVTVGASPPATYDNLGMDPEHQRYFRRVIDGDTTAVITAAPAFPPNATAAPDNRPQTAAAAALAGGTADNPAALTPTDYSAALDRLREVRDVNMVAIPDRQDLQVQIALIDHCRLLADRFAILDSRLSAPLFGADSVDLQRNGLDTDNGIAALYYPWIVVGAGTGTGTVNVPPSGHVAGIYARTDVTRGVHKAPAGDEALVSGAIAVERPMSDIDQGQLNMAGINVIRVFSAGGRPVIWGARTTSNVSSWQYVNIRRLFLYIEGSIEAGIHWALFEPNNLTLWQKLRRTIGEFLTRVWEDGGLFGEKPEDAFYVRIDEALNPFSEQQLGRLNIEIGLRPSYPAEFIVVRIGIWPGGSEVTEG